MDEQATLNDLIQNAYNDMKNSYQHSTAYIPTVSYLKRAIKSKNPKKYNILQETNTDAVLINSANIDGGLGHVVAFSDKPMVFGTGIGQTAQTTLNSLETVEGLTAGTFSNVYTKALRAARNVGDIKLISNFELEFCGPIDARIITPSRATLKDPDWWLTPQCIPVYLYRGMLVSIIAT